MNNDIITQYRNGNTTVTIYEDGTKVREYEDGVIPFSDFPESIDVKITNRCDNGIINGRISSLCKYCHEKSKDNGEHSDLDYLYNQLSELPSGVELALGGGNIFTHPNLMSFLIKAKNKGWICNITVNQKHIEKYDVKITELIDSDLVKGIGISLMSSNLSPEVLKYANYQHTVIHLIAGIHDNNVIDTLTENGFKKLLILGYKVFGDGIKYYNKNKTNIENNIKNWRMYIPKYFNKCTISFDNLAIEQLKIRRFFNDEKWERFYMGDEFTHSMYIDAVNKEYAHNSRSTERISFEEMNLFDYFKTSRR